MDYTAKNIQRAARGWIDFNNWARPYAVTLTLRQQLWVDGDRGRHAVPLTREAASQNLRHFLNVLAKQTLGPARWRHGHRLPTLAVIEGGETKRLHYHLTVDCPRADLIENFPSMVVKAWRATAWGYDQTDVKPCNVGWVDYMLKLRDKPDFGTSIDWLNCHTPH